MSFEVLRKMGRRRENELDGSDDSDDVKVSVSLGLELRDLACGKKKRRGEGKELLALREGELGLKGLEGAREEDVPCSRRNLTIPDHSFRRKSAPVRDPSPPQTTRESIPCSMRLRAAVCRPSMVRTVEESQGGEMERDQPLASSLILERKTYKQQIERFRSRFLPMRERNRKRMRIS